MSAKPSASFLHVQSFLRLAISTLPAFLFPLLLLPHRNCSSIRAAISAGTSQKLRAPLHGIGSFSGRGFSRTKPNSPSNQRDLDLLTQSTRSTTPTMALRVGLRSASGRE